MIHNFFPQELWKLCSIIFNFFENIERKAEAYLEPNQTFAMEFFSENY